MSDGGPNRICNVALIGQRFMGRAHSNAWSQAAKFFDLPVTPAMHSVTGRDEATLAGFAQRWGWRKWTASWREIAADDEIDLVDVAAPNDLHAEMSIAILEAGKHVACEKPLARNLAEAKSMRDAANGCRLSAVGCRPDQADEQPTADSRRPKAPRTFVWFNYRRCPAVALAHNLVKEGRLGRIFHVRANYLQSWGGPETPMSWRFNKAAAGSGAHGDLNAHIIDMARFITGEEITQVHGAVARTFITERLPAVSSRPSAVDSSRQLTVDGRQPSDVDDATLFLASLTGGGLASFEATRLATGNLNANRIEINGEGGAIRFDFENMNVLEFYDAEDAPRLDGWRRIMCTRAGEHPYAGNWWPDGHIIGYEHGFINMAADILRVLGGGEPEAPLPDFEDAYQTQRVLEAAMISATQRCAVAMDDVP